MRRISVVLPVYEEAESIAPCLRGLSSALAGAEHEILVVHDTDEDSTLPAIAAMEGRPASVRLVKNTLGPGALNAIRAGFAAAQGDVVVTSMADLSDPPELIPRMAEKIRAGADVVSGSRYMRGGSQRGGPWLKRTLSRIAGVSLRWITGIGTHDSTSNFRAYSRAFLETVEIESRAGFEVALELTVKAHLAGRRIDEVPSSWVERESGKSNFRLWKWLPSYLRWYLRAAAAPGFVLGVWMVMAISAIHFVATYGSPVPYMDDYAIVGQLGRGKPPSLAWLWAQHNEHRIPIAKFVCWGAIELTNDFRSPMYLQVGFLAAASLALMRAARHVRGRTSATDAFFPVLLLNWGHYENLLSAFQVSFVLPAALVAVVLACIAAGPRAPDRCLASLLGVSLPLLSLSSGAGLVQSIPIAAWMASAGVAAWRSQDPLRRKTGIPLVLGSAITGVLAVIILASFVSPPGHSRLTDARTATVFAIELLSRGAGPVQRTYGLWLLVRTLVALVTILTLVGGFARLRAHPQDRWRELGLLACGAGSIGLALAIAVGRGGDAPALTAPRYVTLFAPFLALLYLAWCRYSTLAGRLVQAGMCLGIAALVPGTVRDGRAYAERRRSDVEALVRDADAGLIPELLSERHWRSFSAEEDRFTTELDDLRRLGLPPYHTPSGEPDVDSRIARPFAYWKSPPVEIRTDHPVARRRILGTRVVIVHAPTELFFEVPPGARNVRLGFGIDPTLHAKPEASTRGVRFRIERGAGSDRSVLFERVLCPVDRAEDRGIQEAAIPLVEDGGGLLVLGVASFGGGDPSRDWGFWTGIEFD